MDVLEQINSHRSVRNFTAEGISRDILERILEAGTRAPTGGSMQLYSIIVTTDATQREALAALHLGSDAVRKAPAVITLCVDTHRLTRWLELHGERPGLDNLWAFAIGFSDALLAAQNILLAAESLGLAGCFLGSTFVSAPVLCRVFECPRHVVPVATLVLGHPAETPRPATRLPTAAVVHWERYVDASAASLGVMYAGHAEATFERFREADYVRQATSALGIGHLAPYYARLMYPRELIETAGAYFFSALQSQGFASDAQLARMRAVRDACESPDIAAMHPIRQLAFAMALVSGHVDHVLGLGSAECEAAISSFLAARDPSILDDVVARGVFDIAVRNRLYGLLAEFEESTVGRAAE